MANQQLDPATDHVHTDLATADHVHTDLATQIFDLNERMVEQLTALQAELAQTKTALSAAIEQIGTKLVTAQDTANRALQTANNAAPLSALGNFLPKSGGRISGTLVVTEHISTNELKVGNIFGHGNQQIHLPGGANEDHIFLNWQQGGQVHARHSIVTPELTVGNIFGHGKQQIHLPGGANKDHIFLNWHDDRNGDVVIHGRYRRE